MTTKENARDGQSRAGSTSFGHHDSYSDQSENSSRKLALPHVVSSWKKGKDEIQVRLDVYAGRHRIDVRTWFTDQAGKVRPGKGISLSLDQLDQLATAINLAAELAHQHGLASRGAER